MLLSLLACKEEQSAPVQVVRTPDATEVRDWSDMSSTSLDMAWFVRASLDIRGHRPLEDELEWASDNPNALSDILDEWLASDAFAHQMAWYWNDLLHTSVWIGQEERFDRFGLTDAERRAIGWEPLSYIEQTLLDDRPLTDIVTTNRVPTTSELAVIFGDDADVASGQWQMMSTERGHPEAGVLASRVLWIRHFVDILNHNRARANFFSATFLCQDYLERDVAFDFSQVSLDNVETAIRTQSECVTCHASLDPLASVFGVFQDNINLELDQMGMPSDFKERWYAGWREPSYFGLPLNNLSELGAYTAADTRFSQCMVEHTWDFLVEETALSDLDRFALSDVLVDSEFRIAEVVRRIVLSDEYREQPRRIVRPEQLLQTIFEMSQLAEGDAENSIDQLLWSPEHRVLFGSTDDVGVLTANPAFTVGHHLALQWLSAELGEVIVSDLQVPPNRRALLTELSDDSNESIQRQIVFWKRSLHSEWVDASDEQVQQLLDFWQGIETTHGPESAWASVLAVLLHDPKAVLR